MSKRVKRMCNRIDDLVKEFERLKRPKGKWIVNDDYVCSICGYHFVVGDGAYNFCPNCGTDMRGEEE